MGSSKVASEASDLSEVVAERSATRGGGCLDASRQSMISMSSSLRASLGDAFGAARIAEPPLALCWVAFWLSRRAARRSSAGRPRSSSAMAYSSTRRRNPPVTAGELWTSS